MNIKEEERIVFAERMERLRKMDVVSIAKEIGELEAENKRLSAAIAESCDDMRYETLMGCERAEAAEALLEEVAGSIGEMFTHETSSEFHRGQCDGWNQCRAYVAAILARWKEERK